MIHIRSLNPLALLLASALLLLGACAAQQAKVSTAPKVLPSATSVPPKHENPETMPSDGSVKPQEVVVIEEQAKPVVVKKLEPVPVTKRPAPKTPSPKTVTASQPPPKVVKTEPEPKPKPVEEAVVAVETVSVPDPVAPPVDVELDKLPITIDGQWQLNAHGDSCSLSTLGVVIDDGQGDTKIRLRLNLDSWILMTESDIDLSYPNTGLILDTGVRFALGAVHRDTNVIFIEARARMIDEFMKAKMVKVALGFWPTWPVTETKIAEIDISHFERAYRAWKLCQSRISAR